MIVLRFLMLMLPFATAVVIDCRFDRNLRWTPVGEMYHCFLTSDPHITLPDTRVTEATGEHWSSRTHANVLGFLFLGFFSQTINNMPQGLDAIFPNLVFVSIINGRVKELRQSDLKAYAKVQCLNFYLNDIAFLEEDLFKYNTQLRDINLRRNKIAEIHASVFDHLSDLTWLYLLSNRCMDRNAENSRQGVLDLIEDAKIKCAPGAVILANKDRQTSEEEEVRSFGAQVKRFFGFQTKKE